MLQQQSETDISLPWADPVPTFTDLSGVAGSGKTFLTKAWAEQEKGLLLCATTGIAAINLGGSTINSQLGYFDTKSLQESYTNGFLTGRLGRLWRAGIRRIVLDEKSMLDADQLTYLVRAIDEVNQKGYVLDSRWEEDSPPNLGLTLVGDFAQLSPVKACYAFESPEWGKFAEHSLTLTDIHRQDDPDFVQALRWARQGDGIRALSYFGDRLQDHTDERFEGPTILAKNDAVDRFNRLRMDKLDGALVTFASSRWGKQRAEWGHPDKPPASWGIPQVLELKEGALVMVLANKRLLGNLYAYVNGDLGTLVSANADTHSATVILQRTQQEVQVEYIQREVKIPCDAERRKELRETGLELQIDGKWEIQGAVSYMPLRLAYASTCHKIQGLSLDRAQVNIRDAFFKTPGMLYVALSRARTSSGLRLIGTAQGLVERCVSDPRLKGWL